LTNVTEAELTGGQSDNTFTVSGWTGNATLEGEDGYDTLISENDADFVLTQTQLSRSTGGTFLLGQFEAVNLTGGAGDNTFTLIDTRLGGTFDGRGGTDEVIARGNANLTLTNSALTRFLPGGDFTFALQRIEKAALIGGADDNTFTVSGWTQAARLDGGGGTDTVVSVRVCSIIAVSRLFSCKTRCFWGQNPNYGTDSQ
jgi:hypothetical protein